MEYTAGQRMVDLNWKQKEDIEPHPVAVSIPCTCGELFQGQVDGEPCLVSCPLSIYRTAHLGRTDQPRALMRKAQQALQRLPSATREGWSIWLDEALPVGRGYGTSTADIGAVLFAAAHGYGLELSSETASRMAVSIEPTDSTLFPGLTLFDHRQGRFFQPLGAAPVLRVFILDPGGFVDSETFNQQDLRTIMHRLSADQQIAFEMLRKGIAAQDIEAIGKAASLSAHLHQAVLFNPLLSLASEIASDLGALGICRAHSGTILGLLFDARICDEERVQVEMERRIPANVRLLMASLADAGPRYNFLEEPGAV